ncbi:pseudouridine synthase [Rhodovibrionaceae bacterium A322]
MSKNASQTPTSPQEQTDGSAWEGERIAKVIARSGICSRRDAEAFIEQGRVELDGKTVETPATKVQPGQTITLDGEALPATEPPRLWRLYKPKGVLTTAFDPEGRPTIYTILPEGLPRTMPVGRLDMTSEGLLLLTNDGELKRRLELPQTGWVRRYRVRVFGRVDEKALRDLSKGITVDGIKYGPIEARLDKSEASNSWLTVALREGKNREVRRICEHLGLTVNRLMRISFGPFVLGALKAGDLEEVSPRVLREQLGDGDKAKEKTAQAQKHPQGRRAKGSKAPRAPRHVTKDTRPVDEEGNPIEVKPTETAKGKETTTDKRRGPRPAQEESGERTGRHARNRREDKAQRDRDSSKGGRSQPRPSRSNAGKPGQKSGPGGTGRPRSQANSKAGTKAGPKAGGRGPAKTGGKPGKQNLTGGRGADRRR